MLAQLPARQLVSPSLQRRVKNMLAWRQAYFPSVREAEEGEKKNIWCGVSEASGATMNSGNEELGYSSSPKADSEWR